MNVKDCRNQTGIEKRKIINEYLQFAFNYKTNSYEREDFILSHVFYMNEYLT